jgi:membrane-bound serine protease (ClpP class)
MRRLSLTALFLVLLGGLACLGSAPAAGAGAVGANAQTPIVEVIDVEGAIDRPLLAYVNDRLDAAERSGAIVVLQLDTSGSLHQDGVVLAERVAHLSVPVITWTGPAPATAGGAGLLLVYASSLAAVSPGAQTGPLFPIDLAAPDLEPPGLTARIQGWLDARGKDTRLERLDEPLTGNEALDLGVVQVAALSVLDLLDKVDGRVVQTPEGPVTLSTTLARDAEQAEQGTVDVRFDNLGPVKRILHGVASPSMIYVLIVVGISALAFELTQPGFGFAGFAGLLLLGLGLYGAWVVPPSILGGAALLGGIGLMIWDVHLRKLGALTALGSTAFAAGSFLAWNSDVAHAIRVSPWLIVGTIVAALLYYGFGLTVAIQSRDRIMATQRGLIGLVGEARGRLSPEGPVFVKGAMWRGRSAGDPILPGQRVRVRGVDGLVLRVEAEPEGEPGDVPG